MTAETSGRDGRAAMTDRRGERETNVAKLLDEVSQRRNDLEFMARLRERIDADGPLLTRLAESDPVVWLRCTTPGLHKETGR